MGKSSKRSSQEQTVIFLHIPKAGGTTLHQIIERQYEPTAVFTGPPLRKWVEEFKALPEAEKGRIRALKGHMRFGLHEFLPQPANYFTMLRDPVDRVLSFYYFARQTPGHYLYDAVTSQQMTLKDLISGKTSTELDNCQTRLISGVGHSIDFGRCSTEVLESAKENLKQHFTVVGLTERFGETLILLKRAFNWRIPLYVKVNVTRDRPRKRDVPKDALSLIEGCNELDIELYRYAKEIFEELVRQQGPSFEREVRVFKLLNKCYGRIHWFSQPVLHGIKALVRNSVRG